MIWDSKKKKKEARTQVNLNFVENIVFNIIKIVYIIYIKYNSYE